MDNAIGVLTSAKSFIVLYGAGASASAGVATFRHSAEQPEEGQPSANTALLKDRSNWDWKQALGTSETQTSNWLKWVASQQAFLETKTPTKFHFWLNLEKYGKIREIFTMNVDDLERKAGLIPEYNYYPLHGSFFNLICLTCQIHQKELQEKDKEFLNQGQFPPCIACAMNRKDPRTRSRRTMGMRPGILLYHDNPSTYIHDRVKKVRDHYKGKRKVDVFLVVGTSIPNEVHHLKATLADLIGCAKKSVYADISPSPNLNLFDYTVQISSDELALHLQDSS
ncbi:NAD-dependent histone deacetylase sir2 [Orbilia oligospora]|uniref:NAD-dependent histone deacetylase sir2 n=1 Tax=Orbilia oligospora TaxID=2813651 RepID=A0A8H2HS65_ORBOL|nr:NAD-dependent histone deacetylase sir2 [Orbilia oligospora]